MLCRFNFDWSWKLCQRYLIFVVLRNFLGEWKPNIIYYDYYAQSRSDAPVKQIFPYVKTAFLRLHADGILDSHKKRLIVSDGGISYINYIYFV